MSNQEILYFLFNFFSQRFQSFDEIYDIKALNDYHPAITMETFMRKIAPKLWPKGKRTGDLEIKVVLSYRFLYDLCQYLVI